MKKRRILWLFVAVCVTASQLFPVMGVSAKTLDEIQKEKDEVTKQVQDTKEDKDDAQQKADQLQDEADALKGTYNSLNQKLQNVTGEITKTQDAITNAKTQKDELETSLEQAKEDQKLQYEYMKKRIQYTYENGTDSLVISILESGSVAEFVKRVEYTANILSYDEKMIDSYEKLQDEIADKTAQLEDKSKELAQYQDTLSAKQDELDDLVMNAGSDYQDKSDEVSVAQMTVEQYDALIASYREQEKSLEAQYAAAQAQIAQQIAAQEAQQEQETGQPVAPEDTSGALSGYSEADLKLMAAIIEAEAGNQSYEGKLAVGTVIMNRVKSSKFPNTLSGVIYQTNQFQPARPAKPGEKPMLEVVLERGPNDSCTQAARQVLDGYRSGDWLFFMTKYWADHYGITGYTMIGAHAFFTKWGKN